MSFNMHSTRSGPPLAFNLNLTALVDVYCRELFDPQIKLSKHHYANDTQLQHRLSSALSGGIFYSSDHNTVKKGSVGTLVKHSSRLVEIRSLNICSLVAFTFLYLHLKLLLTWHQPFSFWLNISSLAWMAKTIYSCLFKAVTDVNLTLKKES